MYLKKKITVLVLAIVAALALSISACGSSDDSPESNEVDTAFVNEMVVHHELAVQMAKIAQQRAEHPETSKLADDIVSTQEKEITEMRTIQSDLSSSSGHSGSMDGMEMSSGMGTEHSMSADAETLGMSPDEMGMSMDVSSLRTAMPFDQAFIQMMLPHHQGAVEMAKAELKDGVNPDLRSLAERIISAQTKEIGEMQTWFSDWYPDASIETSGSMTG